MSTFRTLTVLEWCKLFGIELVDNDSFTVDVDATEVRLEYFLERISACTINPIDKGRYAVLNDLLK